MGNQNNEKMAFHNNNSHNSSHNSNRNLFFRRSQDDRREGNGSSSDGSDPTCGKEKRTVLIFSSSGHEGVPAQALMQPIISFMRAVRTHSNEPVVILSERAEEMVALTDEIAYAHPGVLTHVHFVAGVTRNLNPRALLRLHMGVTR